MFHKVRYAVLATTSLVAAMPALGSEQDALKYFQRGEKMFYMEDYEEAISEYSKAIQEVGRDGRIEVDRDKKVKRHSYGRGFTEDVHYDVRYADYEPNARMALAQKKLKQSKPPVLNVELAYRDATGDHKLSAGENAKLVATVSNHGGSTANNVTLNISSPHSRGMRFSRYVSLGDIAAGYSATMEVPVNGTKKLHNGGVSFEVLASEKDGFKSDSVALNVDSQGFLPPNLVLANVRIKDSNGNGSIEQVEMVEVAYTLRNIGAGPALSVQSEVVSSKDVRLVDETQQTQNFDAIAPGESKTLRFTFYTNKKIAAKSKIPLSLRVSEAEGEYGMFQDLKLVMGEGFASNVQFAAIPAAAPVLAPVIPLADVDLNIPQGTLSRPDAIAVVIGNTNYIIPGVPKVEYAVRDAKTMKQYLISAMGFREGNIIFVEDATSAKFAEIFGTQRNHKGKLNDWVKEGKSEVFVYYAGHGAPDVDGKSAYFVPVDADPNYIANTGYAVETFYKNLAKLPAKSTTVVIDACFSGQSEGGFLLKNISPALIKYNLPKAELERATVMASSSKDQVSSWYPEKGHSLYTYFFLKGLGGAADTDKNNEITTAELGKYLDDNVPYMARRLNGKNQNPTHNEQEPQVLAAY